MSGKQVGIQVDTVSGHAKKLTDSAESAAQLKSVVDIDVDWTDAPHALAGLNAKLQTSMTVIRSNANTLSENLAQNAGALSSAIDALQNQDQSASQTSARLTSTLNAAASTEKTQTAAATGAATPSTETPSTQTPGSATPDVLSINVGHG